MNLQPADQERYGLLKKAITDGLAVCYVVGAALREIKERKYYQADGYKTFEEFTDSEYGWTKRYCNQLIVDAKAINSLPESMRKLITSHEAAKQLARLPEALRPAVIEEVIKTGKPITAKEIKKISPKIPARKKNGPPPRKATKKEPIKECDRTGIPIPVEIKELWDRSGEARETITYLNSVLLRLKQAQENKDPLFAELDFTDDLAKLSMVKEDLSRAVPYAVCPTCQGKLTKDCLSCKGRGFVSEFYWFHSVPEETRKIREADFRKKGKQ